MPPTSTCPLCASSREYKLLYNKNGIPILRCPECGSGKADCQQFDAADYYSSSYFNGERPDGYSNYTQASSVLRAQFRKDIKLLEKLGSPGKNLVELGCAYGYFLDEAKAAAYQVRGLELCEDAVESCNIRGHEVFHGEVCEQALSQFSEVDTIVMLDVIEHLPDPVAALHAASTSLRPGGLLLITTGDFSSRVAKSTASNWRLMTPPQHLWFFTPRSLTALCNRLDMDLVHLDYPWKTVPVGLIVYQVLRYLTTPPALPSWTHRIGIPVNLFDAMRLVFRKRSGA